MTPGFKPFTVVKNTKDLIKMTSNFVFLFVVCFITLCISRHESSAKQQQAARFVSDILEKLALSPCSGASVST